MKKVLFVLAACLTIALGFTSCNSGIAKVTVEVKDFDNNPIADRKVYYTDLASVIIGIALPDPNAPIKENNDDHLCYGTTGPQGTVTFEYNIWGDLIYYFYVYDEGANQWREQHVTLKKGYVKELSFQINE
ncbi:MAG: hypothetical protein II928_05105 [Paludibacteraceae bacterium]|nr:hypothetical protein [Paludibacteraceae bacterium]